MNWQDWKWVAVVGAAIVAAILAWRRTPGWGWFLFLAFVCAVTNT